jgi:tetratricopeptide (TPR) repeat protein
MSPYRFVPLLAVLTLAAPARAGDATSEAREHFRRGTTLYDLRRYREAAREYEAAYELKDEPALLFNIAQAYRLAAAYDEAIGAYRSFLRRQPRSPNRAEVEERIREMQELLARGLKTQESPPVGTLAPAHPPDEGAHASGAAAATSATATKTTVKTPVAAPPATIAGGPARVAASATAPPPPIARRARLEKIAGIASLAVGVAAIASAAATAALASSASAQLARESKYDPSLAARGAAEQNASIALFTVGGVALAAGVALEIISARTARARRFAVLPAIDQHHAGVLAQFHF